MKTYMPAVERRIVVRPNPVWGIINYDADNAYPQRVLELVRQSPTAKKCWNLRAKYIHGNGFEEPGLGDVIVNDKKGLTLAILLKHVSKDKGLFPGYGIHVNYNANYKVSSVNFVKYEDIRQGDTDCEKYRGKYVIYSDWAKKTWKSIYTQKFDVLYPFNPDPKAVKQQVIEAGGWDKYKGQLFYLTPVVDDYELCDIDPALEDVETEAGIKIFNNREITTGFMPSAVLFMPTRREEEDNDQQSDGMGGYVDTQNTQMQKDLATFQGAKEAQKIIVIEFDPGAENKPELKPFDMQNNDKRFEVTVKAVESRIIKSADVPKELVTTDSNNGLSNGGEKKEAIRELNDNTAPDRLEISQVFEKIFANFYKPVNPSGNWNIIEITTEGSTPDVIKAGADILALCKDPQLTRDNKVHQLVNVYGFKMTEAEAMVPDDNFIKENTPNQEVKQSVEQVEQEAAA